MATLYRRNGKYSVCYSDVDGRLYRVATGTADKRHAGEWKAKVENLLAQARLGSIEKVGRIDAGTILGKEKRDCLTLSAFQQKYAER